MLERVLEHRVLRVSNGTKFIEKANLPLAGLLGRGMHDREDVALRTRDELSSSKRAYDLPVTTLYPERKCPTDDAKRRLAAGQGLSDIAVEL